MENNAIWIRIQINNYSLLEGQDELISELSELCIVQAKKKWYPAACTGCEFLVALNFNLTLEAFLNNVLIPGAELWAFTKICRKVWDTFSKFLKKNEGFDLQNLELCFNDVTIRVVGSPTYGTLVKLYQSFPHHFEILKKKEITEMSEIILPYTECIDEESGETTYDWTYWDTPEEKLLWKIRYLLGCETCYYCPKKEIII